VSSELGKGATFTVFLRLPLGDDPAEGPDDLLPPAAVLPSVKVAASRRVLDVLVCEDNVVNQKVVNAMLLRLGHRVTMAADGLAAWEFLQTRTFDLVLTDIEMPGLTGVELTRKIRRREAESSLERVPIIGATAHVGADEQHALLDAGMDAYLGKPFTLRDLGAIIDRTVITR